MYQNEMSSLEEIGIFGSSLAKFYNPKQMAIETIQKNPTIKKYHTTIYSTKG
jgi:hypothetical protein